MLKGQAGSDSLSGGDGNDHLYGGIGHDSLLGGAGTDTFFFTGGTSSKQHALADVIGDFSQADHDQINVHGFDADHHTAGNQDFTFIGDSAFSGTTAGELRYVQDAGAGVTYLEGDYNGDGHADFSIAVTGLVDFTTGDFVL